MRSIIVALGLSKMRPVQSAADRGQPSVDPGSIHSYQQKDGKEHDIYYTRFEPDEIFSYEATGETNLLANARVLGVIGCREPVVDSMRKIAKNRCLRGIANSRITEMSDTTGWIHASTLMEIETQTKVKHFVMVETMAIGVRGENLKRSGKRIKGDTAKDSVHKITNPQQLRDVETFFTEHNDLIQRPKDGQEWVLKDLFEGSLEWSAGICGTCCLPEWAKKLLNSIMLCKCCRCCTMTRGIGKALGGTYLYVCLHAILNIYVQAGIYPAPSEDLVEPDEFLRGFLDEHCKYFLHQDDAEGSDSEYFIIKTPEVSQTTTELSTSASD